MFHGERRARAPGAVDPAWLQERLEEPARAFHVTLSPGQIRLLARYLSLLLVWNRRINLTGARSPEALADDHLADALALVPHLPGHPARLVDVGSGAGLPGLVLAVVRPDLDVVLLEPHGKRHVFLVAACRELNLSAGGCRRERLEDHLRSPDFSPYDVAVSRAAWVLPDWLALGARLVRSGGLVLGLEGRTRTALPAAAERHPYRLGTRSRAVITLRT